VDVEFAMDQGKLYVLQCRPLGGEMSQVRTPVPAGIASTDKVFSARLYVNNGTVDDIEYVVLIDPRDYLPLGRSERLHLARAVGEINHRLREKKFILMGPGRWGSQDLRLGVQVSYADIDNARALIEIARKSEGFSPEPSFGTHFFQDLIEASILYLPLDPEDPEAIFNEDILLGGENAFPAICPEHASLADAVRVLDIQQRFPGRRLRLVMDGEVQEALCFLE